MFERLPPPSSVPVVVGLVGALAQVDAAQHAGELADAAEVVALLRAAEAAQALALRSLAAFDAAGGYALPHPEVGTYPHASAAAFLRQTLTLAEDDARGRVRLARALSARGPLAELGDLVVDGRSTLRHAIAVRDGVRGLDPAVVAEALPALSLLAQATDPVTVARELRERAHAVSDDLAAEQERQQRERRGFWASRSTDGMAHYKGQAPGLEADLVEEALTREMTRQRAALDVTGQKDTRDLPQRRLDALVALARHALSSDSVDGGGPLVGAAGVRAAVTVVVSADQLAAVPGAPPARTTSSAQTVLSRSTLLALTCDADLTRVTLDGHAPTSAFSGPVDALLAGALAAVMVTTPVALDLGRTVRTVSTGHWRALVARDRTCVIVGCARPASGCVAHHVQHWARGGPSDLANYALLCHQHHHDVHADERLWHRHRDGRWITPDGYRPAGERAPDLRSTVTYGGWGPPPPEGELF